MYKYKRKYAYKHNYSIHIFSKNIDIDLKLRKCHSCEYIIITPTHTYIYFGHLAIKIIDRKSAQHEHFH